MSVKNYRDELIARYNAEECVGNLIAVVNGKKEVIATFDHDSVALTAVGSLLEAKREAAEAKELADELEEAPRRRGRPPKAKPPVEEDTDGEPTYAGELDEKE